MVARSVLFNRNGGGIDGGISFLVVRLEHNF